MQPEAGYCEIENDPEDLVLEEDNPNESITGSNNLDLLLEAVELQSKSKEQLEADKVQKVWTGIPTPPIQSGPPPGKSLIHTDSGTIVVKPLVSTIGYSEPIYPTISGGSGLVNKPTSEVVKEKTNVNEASTAAPVVRVIATAATAAKLLSKSPSQNRVVVPTETNLISPPKVTRVIARTSTIMEALGSMGSAKKNQQNPSGGIRFLLQYFQKSVPRFNTLVTGFIENLLQESIKNGALDVIQGLFDEYGTKMGLDKFLNDRDVSSSEGLVNLAFKEEQWKIVDWLIDRFGHCLKINKASIIKAVKREKLELLEQCEESSAPVILEQAVDQQKWKLASWAISKFGAKSLQECQDVLSLLVKAARAGQLAFLKAVHAILKDDFPFNESTESGENIFDAALCESKLEIIKWWRDTFMKKVQKKSEKWHRSSPDPEEAPRKRMRKQDFSWNKTNKWQFLYRIGQIWCEIAQENILQLFN